MDTIQNNVAYSEPTADSAAYERPIKSIADRATGKQIGGARNKSK